MKLDKATTIINEEKFIKSHLALIKNYGKDSKISKPYLERLEKFCTLKKMDLNKLLDS